MVGSSLAGESRRVRARLACALAAGLAGCTQSVTPAAMMDMRSLPDDPSRRKERLDSIAARPGPENHKPMPAAMRRVETAAATAAAVLGMIFTKNPSVLLGAATPFDENRIVDPSGGQVARPDEDEGAEKKKDAGRIDPTKLVPWVVLGPDAPRPAPPDEGADGAPTAPPAPEPPLNQPAK